MPNHRAPAPEPRWPCRSHRLKSARTPRGATVRIWLLSALSLGAATGILGGCGASQPPIGAQSATQQVSALSPRSAGTSYKVVYSFGAAPDGNRPVASLIDVGGTLYGTTKYGGNGYNCRPSGGCGTVFSLTTGGTERVLYSFGSQYRGEDGMYPLANLSEVHGALYGTTVEGGGGWGVVFTVTAGGTEKVVHSFLGDLDPAAGLIDVGGTLYGTTEYGGDTNGLTHGAVFSISSGGYKELYHFGNARDGERPAASVIEVDGMLYGTTLYGGAYRRKGGTVFGLTTGGTENVLHSFGNGEDGRELPAALTNVRGTFYGTTS